MKFCLFMSGWCCCAALVSMSTGDLGWAFAMVALSVGNLVCALGAEKSHG